MEIKSERRGLASGAVIAILLLVGYGCSDSPGSGGDAGYPDLGLDTSLEAAVDGPAVDKMAMDSLTPDGVVQDAMDGPTVKPDARDGSLLDGPAKLDATDGPLWDGSPVTFDAADGSLWDGPLWDGPLLDGPAKLDATDGPLWDGPVISPDGALDASDGPLPDGPLPDGPLPDAPGGFSDAGLFPDAGGAAPSWDPRFPDGCSAGLTTMAHGGGFLYVACSTWSGGLSYKGVARWDLTNHRWEALGSGVSSGVVKSIAVVGDNVYVGGSFTSAGGVAAAGIARWNAKTKSWSALGTGLGAGSHVTAIAASGTKVYVGGVFDLGTTRYPSTNFAIWDESSSTWFKAQSGVWPNSSGTPVHSIAVGSSGVYVGGNFSIATSGGIPVAYNIARWNGASWSGLTSGGTNWSDYGADGTVTGVTINGSDLYVVGVFTSVGSVKAEAVARYSITSKSWSALGAGIPGASAAAPNDVAVYGVAVYVGGNFKTGYGAPANYLARWNGSTWSAVSGGVKSSVQVMVQGGGALYVGGPSEVGGIDVAGIGRWNGSTWSGLRHGFVGVGMPAALAASGTEVYVAGTFSSAGGVGAANVARWDRTSGDWSALGSGVDDEAFALALDGSGGVYVGGQFTKAGGASASHIARWDSGAKTWSPLGGGVNGHVHGIAASATAVYAGGTFTTAGGKSASGVARWDVKTQTWSPMSSGVSGVGYVNALALDPTTGDLYAGGTFSSMGGVAASGVARWDGTTWGALGAGVGTSQSAALLVDCTGVYVSGGTGNITRWNGSTWSNLGSGVNGQVQGIARATNGLYVTGSFTTAGGAAANYIAQWTGTKWLPLMAGTTNGLAYQAHAIAASGAHVYVTGSFNRVGGISSKRFAHWGY